MTDTPGGPLAYPVAGPGRQWTLAAVAILALLAFPIAWTIWPPRVAGGFSDAVEYLLLADHYAHSVLGRAIFDPSGTAEYAARTRLPPLYPLVLAFLGGGASNVQAAFLATGAMLLVAGLALNRAYAAECGSRDAALLTVAATASFGFLTLALEPLSEPLFIALAAASLALVAWSRRNPGGWWLAATAVALVPLARTIGVSWLLGFAFLVAQRRELPIARRGALVALAAAPTAAWLLLHGSGGSANYASAVSAEALVAAFGGIDAWLLGMPGRLSEALASYWTPAPESPLAAAAAAVLGSLALLGWFIRARAGRLDAYAAPVYLAILAAWPFPEELPRLLAPLVPFALLAAVAGGERILELSGRARNAVAPAVVLLAVACGLPTLARATARAFEPVPPRLSPFKRDASYLAMRSSAQARRELAIASGVFELTASLQEHVAPGECVYTSMPYQALLYAGVNAIELPHELDLSRPVAPQLQECRYVLATARATSQHRYSGVGLQRALGRDARIVAVAHLDAPGHDSSPGEVAGVLLELHPEAVR